MGMEKTRPQNAERASYNSIQKTADGNLLQLEVAR